MNENLEAITDIEEFSPYKIKPSHYKDIIDKYSEGSPVKNLSKEYGVNLQTIYRILKKCKIKPTGAGRPKKFSEKQQEEIIEDYKKNISSVEIAKKCGVSATTILNVIKSKGIDVRKSGPQQGKCSDHYKFKRKVSKEDHKVIAERYKQGESSPKLAKEFDVSRERICKILDSMGVDRRSKKISDKEIENVIELYDADYSVRSISEKVGRSQSTIVSVLSNKGIKIERGRGVRKIKEQDYDELIKRYKNGDKLKDIANTYGVKAPTIGQILKNLGVEKNRISSVKTYRSPIKAIAKN